MSEYTKGSENAWPVAGTQETKKLVRLVPTVTHITPLQYEGTWMPLPLLIDGSGGKKRWTQQRAEPKSRVSSPVAESREKLKSLLMKVKEEREKAGLKLNIQKSKIMASHVNSACSATYSVHDSHVISACTVP